MRSFQWYFFVCCIPLSLILGFTFLVTNLKPVTTPVAVCEGPVVSNGSFFAAPKAGVAISLTQAPVNFFANLLNTDSWPARWNCGLWTPFHGWLYISSDFLIWLSYFMIPLILGFYLYRKKASTPFRGIFLLFISFILACGLTHLMDVAIFWWPAYRLSALIRFATAAISMSTVFALVKITPKVMRYKSPEDLEKLVSELTDLNQRLQNEVEQREKAEAELKKLNEELERKVDIRTIDLKASNDSLKHINELFKSAQEAANIGIWELNIHEERIYCSDEVYRIYGFEPGTDFDLNTAFDFVHPDHRASIKSAISHAIETQSRYDEEIKIITPKNKVVWIRVVGQPVIRDNEVVALRGLLMDIDEIKTSAQKIEENQRILSLALEAGEIGVWNWNIKEETLEWDDYLHKLFDHPKKNFKGVLEDLINRIHPEDVDKVNYAIASALKGESKFDINYRILTRKGEMRIVHSKGEVSKDMKGAAVRMTGICTDITEQKLHEQTLKESEQRFRASVDYSPIGVALVDLNGQLQRVNPALTEMLGYSEKGLLKLGFNKITYPQDRDIDKIQIKKMLAGKLSSYQVDKRYMRSDSTTIWIQQNVSMVMDINKTPKYFIAQILDITERKMAERKIHEVVRQRTAQLEATNQELEAFSYSVSHDLRSPLRSIHGFSQALLEDYGEKLDDTGKDYLNRVSAASVKMGQLIDDLLALSRITRQDMNVEVTDISSLAEQVADQLKNDRYTGTRFIIEHGLKIPADKGLLNVALENLMENAAKYSRGSKTPMVEFGEKRINDRQVFYIRDNGVGFNMEYADKLFGAFQRLHNVEEFEGTGIGLATVKRVIHRHGGEIWAKSSVGEGATFYFTLN